MMYRGKIWKTKFLARHNSETVYLTNFSQNKNFHFADELKSIVNQFIFSECNLLSSQYCMNHTWFWLSWLYVPHRVFPCWQEAPLTPWRSGCWGRMQSWRVLSAVWRKRRTIWGTTRSAWRKRSDATGRLDWEQATAWVHDRKTINGIMYWRWAS